MRFIGSLNSENCELGRIQGDAAVNQVNVLVRSTPLEYFLGILVFIRKGTTGGLRIRKGCVSR